MVETALSIVLGIIVGGLSISAGWGVFWLALASAGLVRGTSGWKVVRASFAAGAIPGVLLLWIWLAMDRARLGSWSFALGLVMVPGILTLLGLRKLPDGTRVAWRLIGGVEMMMDTILGRHHGCGGCGDEHHHGAS